MPYRAFPSALLLLPLSLCSPAPPSLSLRSRDRDRRDDDRDDRSDRRRDRPSQFSDAPKDESSNNAANTVLMAALLTQARQLAGGGGMQGVSGPSVMRKARRLHVSNLPADIGITKESISAFFNSAMEMAKLSQSPGPCVVDVQCVARTFPRCFFVTSRAGTRWASALRSWSFARRKKRLRACS